MNLFWSSLAVKEKNQLNAVRSQETQPKKCVHQSGRQKGELMKVEYSN